MTNTINELTLYHQEKLSEKMIYDSISTPNNVKCSKEGIIGILTKSMMTLISSKIEYQYYFQYSKIQLIMKEDPLFTSKSNFLCQDWLKEDPFSLGFIGFSWVIHPIDKYKSSLLMTLLSDGTLLAFEACKSHNTNPFPLHEASNISISSIGYRLFYNFTPVLEKNIVQFDTYRIADQLIIISAKPDSLSVSTLFRNSEDQIIGKALGNHSLSRFSTPFMQETISSLIILSVQNLQDKIIININVGFRQTKFLEIRIIFDRINQLELSQVIFQEVYQSGNFSNLINSISYFAPDFNCLIGISTDKLFTYQISNHELKLYPNRHPFDDITSILNIPDFCQNIQSNYSNIFLTSSHKGLASLWKSLPTQQLELIQDVDIDMKGVITGQNRDPLGLLIFTSLLLPAENKNIREFQLLSNLIFKPRVKLSISLNPTISSDWILKLDTRCLVFNRLLNITIKDRNIPFNHFPLFLLLSLDRVRHLLVKLEPEILSEKYRLLEKYLDFVLPDGESIDKSQLALLNTHRKKKIDIPDEFSDLFKQVDVDLEDPIIEKPTKKDAIINQDIGISSIYYPLKDYLPPNPQEIVIIGLNLIWETLANLIPIQTTVTDIYLSQDNLMQEKNLILWQIWYSSVFSLCSTRKLDIPHNLLNLVSTVKLKMIIFDSFLRLKKFLDAINDLNNEDSLSLFSYFEWRTIYYLMNILVCYTNNEFNISIPSLEIEFFEQSKIILSKTKQNIDNFLKRQKLTLFEDEKCEICSSYLKFNPLTPDLSCCLCCELQFERCSYSKHLVSHIPDIRQSDHQESSIYIYSCPSCKSLANISCFSTKLFELTNSFDSFLCPFCHFVLSPIH